MKLSEYIDTLLRTQSHVDKLLPGYDPHVSAQPITVTATALSGEIIAEWKVNPETGRLRFTKDKEG